jgi:hypothetical protein
VLAAELAFATGNACLGIKRRRDAREAAATGRLILMNSNDVTSAVVDHLAYTRITDVFFASHSSISKLMIA